MNEDNVIEELARDLSRDLYAALYTTAFNYLEQNLGRNPTIAELEETVHTFLKYSRTTTYADETGRFFYGFINEMP